MENQAIKCLTVQCKFCGASIKADSLFTLVEHFNLRHQRIAVEVAQAFIYYVSTYFYEADGDSIPTYEATKVSALSEFMKRLEPIMRRERTRVH